MADGRCRWVCCRTVLPCRAQLYWHERESVADAARVHKPLEVLLFIQGVSLRTSVSLYVMEYYADNVTGMNKEL